MVGRELCLWKQGEPYNYIEEPGNDEKGCGV